MVLAGSIARRDPSLSSHDTVEPRREELLGSGVIAVCKKGYRFERDWVFGTSSAAASIVTGGAANGWTEWKNARGQDPDEYDRFRLVIEYPLPLVRSEVWIRLQE